MDLLGPDVDSAVAGVERRAQLERAVACVDRELRMRLAAYPRWVAQKKLTQKKADDELAGMREVRRMLIFGFAAQEVMGPVDPAAAIVVHEIERLERLLPACP